MFNANDIPWPSTIHHAGSTADLRNCARDPRFASGSRLTQLPPTTLSCSSVAGPRAAEFRGVITAAHRGDMIEGFAF